MKSLTDLTNGMLLRFRIVEDALHGEAVWTMGLIDGTPVPAEVVIRADSVEFVGHLPGPLPSSFGVDLFSDGVLRHTFMVTVDRQALEGDIATIRLRLNLALTITSVG